MDTTNDLSTEEYLAKHHILLYIEDAISQLLEYKDEHPKVIHSKFLADYFRSVHQGVHTLYREYKYVSATPHNRSCFIKCVWTCFRHIATHGELLSVKEYHSLLGLLCHDFPMEVVQQTARIVLMDDALDCLMSFTDFLYAFQVQFYYEDYIHACKEVYEHLASGTTTVFVPSTENWQQSLPSDSSTSHENKQTEGVSSHSFFDAIEKLPTKLGKNTPMPRIELVQAELEKVERVNFYGFLMALSKNDDINNDIGNLPSRDNLLDGTDADVILRS